MKSLGPADMAVPGTSDFLGPLPCLCSPVAQGRECGWCATKETAAPRAARGGASASCLATQVLETL